MFLPWSLITGRPKTVKNTPSESKQKKPLRRSSIKVEALEDRVVPANYFVDASFLGASTGSLVSPFKTIQDALNAANANPGLDNVFVYGNNSTDPAVSAYVWERDGDRELINEPIIGNGLLDGNLDVGTDASNPVNLFLRASVRNTATVDGSGGSAANLIVKMRDNIVDVRDGSQLRLEGTNDAARVIFTSIFDDAAGGDSNGDDLVNLPQRANWGGIRFRAEAIDQGPTSATGSLVNFADIRYSGQTIFDEVGGFFAEFGSVRMEANSSNPANIRSAQVRVWNTIFQHGGRALDINVNALGQGGKASSLATGPELGVVTPTGVNNPLRFIDNTINGAFIFIPSDVFTGFTQQQMVNTILDDVGTPYVITTRWILAHPQTTPGLPGQITLTFNEGTILKSQNTGLDGIDLGQPNDRTFGTIRVNGSVNRPVLFTSLTDDALIANTDLAALYNNGSIDTNNDGEATVPEAGDWGGIRIANGNIDHAQVRYGGGFVQSSGTFSSWPAIRVFARDLSPYGQGIQAVRIANTEVTQTYSVTDPNNPADSPAIDLFSRDDGDARYDFGNTPLRRTGDVQIMDNNIHDNQGKAIQAHPLYFHDARNSTGGYGVYMARNIINSNASNGVYIQFILDQSRGIDQNLPTVGGVFDDSDIVHVVEGQALIVHPDQFFQMMSQRGVLPDTTAGGYLQKFNDINTFLANLKLRLPGNLPTDLTKPLELPLQQGPLSVNPSLVDSGLFYYLTNFNTTSRNVPNPAGTTLRGEEWRDWGVNFVYTGLKSNLVDPLGLYPFAVSADPNNASGRILTSNTLNGDGSFEMVFPDQVTAVGFYINNNTSTSPNEKIELFDANGRLIDSAPLPTTTAGGRTYFARITKTPIYRVRITENAGDNAASATTFSNTTSTAIPDNGVVDIPINVGSSFNIQDVNVSLNIIHSNARQLQLDLVAPDGTIVRLNNASTGTGANYTATYFDDSATINIDLASPSYSGFFAPTSFDPFSATLTGLGVLNGKNANGIWKLRVRDTVDDPNVSTQGNVTNFTLQFKSNTLALESTGISGLTWVQAPSNLVIKANSPDTLFTAGGVRQGYGQIQQDAQGVIINGFVPQMATNSIGANAAGMFTYGQSTQTVFNRTGPVSLVEGGPTLINIDVTNDFVPYDMTLNLNLTYGGLNSQLRIRLRAPDGTEIDLVSPGQAPGSGFTAGITFDDQTALPVSSYSAPATTTVQSSSFSTTRTTNPSQTTPFGMSFFRGKNARGSWVLVIEKQNGQAGTFNDATLSFRGMTGGWGSTLRILGQGNAPVIMTGIQDDTAGAGPVGNVQFDNGSDGPTTAGPGQWRGIQLMPGINSNVSEVVTQNPNGTLNRRYSDLNPYTRGDEGVFYPTINNPNGVLLSTQDDFHTAVSALNGGTTAATRAPFDVGNRANVQDGSLIEYADIRFAQTGIDTRVYPRNKLTIDANEYERTTTMSNGSESNPNNALIQPTPVVSFNERQQLRFETVDGTYKVAGRAGGMSDSQTTLDVDWYQLPNPPVDTSIYVDIESGNRTNGFDEPTGRKFSIAAYDNEFRLIFWSGPGGGYLTNPNGANAGNTLGPIPVLAGDQPFSTATGFTRDVRYIAVMPVGRVPRSFIDSQQPDGLGQPPTSWVYNLGTFQASPTGADGGAYTTFPVNGGDPTNPTADWPWDPAGYGGVAPQGGYEMTLRMTGGERHLDTPRNNDGQILIRSNTISQSSGDAIALSDSRMQMGNTNLGADMPLQAARFPFNAVNRATNNNGNPFRNEDVNPTNPQFSAPANFVPGVMIHNNLIIRNFGNGISSTEDRFTNNVTGAGLNNPSPYSSNTVTPTAFHQIFNNTIDSNTLAGIRLETRGGPTVENNIVSNNGSGLIIVDGYDILTNTPAVVPVVSYNIFYRNTTSGTFSGSNNIVGNTAAQDPQYIDPSINDYRIKVTSPAVDSAISDLQDRLRSARFAQIPTRAPNLDLRGRSRIDNPSRPNVGSGAFPFYDRGALETNELALRVIGLSILTDSGIIGNTFSTITITFAGRVDAASFNTNSVQVRRTTPTGTIVSYQPQLTSNVYDINSDTHTWTLVFATPFTDGLYYLLMDGSTTAAVKDIAGQLLDGEFPAPYNLPSGNGAAGGNFQYPFTIRTGTVSGTIWNNPDADGVIDPGETGIGAATVRLNGPGADGVLFTGDDIVVATATSSAAGAYTFANVGSGRYYVNVVQSSLPTNYRLNTPPADKIIDLPIGGIRANVNFGYWLDAGTANVTGNIFSDLNGNGIFNPGEPPVVPLGGVTVTLTSGGADFDLSTTGDNLVYTAITNTFGIYTFAGVPGNQIFGNNYRLDVDETAIPNTFVRTSPLIVPVTFFLTPGGSFVQNYGYQEKQSVINGTVFNDADGSGTLNGAEGGIQNVTVRLLGAGIDGLFGTADDLPTIPMVTDANGFYAFGSLTAGNYRVVVDSASPVLNNYFLTTGNNSQDIILASGNETATAANVGYRQDLFNGQIFGLVFNDLNGNAQYDLGEPGFGGVNVQLRWAGRNNVINDSDDQIYNFTTDGAGAYTASSLPVGTFYVTPTTGIPAGFGPTGPASIPSIITLGFGGSYSGNDSFFGYQPANATISGLVFNDLDGNGVLDGSETDRFGGVRVYIDSNSNGIFDAGEKNAISAAFTGVYTISGLTANAAGYRVRIDTLTSPVALPAGFVPSTAQPQLVPVGPSQNVTDINMGVQQRNAQVLGRVFIDLNNNGTFDVGEVGSPNQTITLTYTGSTIPSNFAPVQFVMTGSDGTYAFAGLPAGSYSVSTTVPTGGTIGSPGNPQAVNLSAGASGVLNFPVQFPGGGQTAGVWYFTFAGVNTVLTNSDGSQLVVNDTDIVRLTAPTAGVWTYSVFFKGSSFGLSNGGSEGIDAFTFTNSGQIIISTRGTHSVNTTFLSQGVGSGAAISGFGEDLLRFTPSAPNAGFGIQGGTWSRFFDGSRVGLSGSSENVDAVSIIYNAAGTAIDRILLSTTGTALVTGGISANPQDVLAFKPTTQSSLGASTAGTYNKFFVGSSEGFNNPTLNNVDALFYQRDPVSPYSKPSLFMSTAGGFSVVGGGNNGDIVRFNATSGGPTGLLAGDFDSVSLRGSNFGHALANTTGFWQGTTLTDPNPFAGVGSGSGSSSSFALGFASASSSAASFTTDSASGAAQVAQAMAPATSSSTASAAKVVASSISSKAAQAVTTSNNTGKVVSEQADSFFANSKRNRSSAAVSLAKNLLARLK